MTRCLIPCAASMSGPPPLQSADQLLRGPQPAAAGGGAPRRRARCSFSPARARARRGSSPGASPTWSWPAGVPPWRILAVTFTNKAAREMRERLATLLGPWAAELNVSTFHSAAATILRREAEKVGLTRSFVIYDDTRPAAAGEAGHARGAGGSGAQPPRRAPPHRRGEERRPRARTSRGSTPDDYRGLAVQRAYRAYQKLLRAANAVDFGDLLLLLVELLRKDAEVAGEVPAPASSTCWSTSSRTPTRSSTSCCSCSRRRPDANLVRGGRRRPVHLPLARRRGEQHPRLPGGLPRRPGGEAGAELPQRREHPRRRQRGHRPEPAADAEEALDRAAQGRAAAPAHLPRRARGGARGGAAHPPLSTRRTSSPTTRWRSSTGSTPRAGCSRRRCGWPGCPYTLVSGRSFYERAEISDAASYLRLMVNPRSDADLLRIVNVPARAIGDTTAERLSAWAADARGSRCGRPWTGWRTSTRCSPRRRSASAVSGR